MQDVDVWLSVMAFRNIVKNVFKDRVS